MIIFCGVLIKPNGRTFFFDCGCRNACLPSVAQGCAALGTCILMTGQPSQSLTSSSSTVKVVHSAPLLPKQDWQ